jgi:transcription elongation GreA/GreB family factor
LRQRRTLATSRAFVKEQDGESLEELPDRLISPHANFVTARGLALIDAELDRLRAQFAEAQRTQDRAALAHVSRDLRYWTQRRACAQLIAPPAVRDKVAFATRATIRREDRRQQTFTIVGEDEADPAQGMIAYVAPLARALLGKKAGDFADAPGGEVEIMEIVVEL